MTIADARATLHDALTTAGIDAQDRIVHPGDATSPNVQINYTGSDGTEYLFQVEVYVRAGDPTIADAQDVLDDLMQQVNDALDAASIGPIGDSVTADQSLDCWVGVFSVNMPRSDF